MKGTFTMKNYLRTTMSVLLLSSIMAGAFWAISVGKAQAEAADSQIPDYLKGRQFSIDFGNGDRMTSVSIVNVVLVHHEPLWIVTTPATPGHPGVKVTVNPRQIRMLEDLP
jgi:hypothetical protein